MMKESFTNQNGSYKRLPSDFYYVKYELNNYKEEGSTVYATLAYDIDLKDKSTTIHCNSTELLVSMLNLYDRLNRNNVISRSVITFGQYKDNTVAKIISTWCRKNGYPFDISPKPKSGQRQLFELQNDKVYVFYVSRFLRQLNEIYVMYSVYNVLKGYDDTIHSSMYTSDGRDAHAYPHEIIDIKQLTKDEYKVLFETKYSKIQFENGISFNGGVHWTIKTHDLFDTAFHQLALMLYSGDSELKKCPLCGEYFEPDRGNQKYCKSKSCYAQKAYKRKMANKKKQSKEK